MRHVKILLLAAVALLVATGCSLASEPVPAGPIQRGPMPGAAPVSPANQPVLAEGEAIYVDNCAACHGDEGSGDGPSAAQLEEMGVEMPDFTDESFYTDNSPADMFHIITNGTMGQGGMMPPWGESLSNDQRWDVAYYLYTLSAGEDTLAEGQSIYESTLAACVDEQALNDTTVTSNLTAEELAEEHLAACAADLDADGLTAAALYALNLPVDRDTPLQVSEQPNIVDEPAAEEEPAVEEEPVTEDDTVVEESTAEEAAAPQLGTVFGTVTLGETAPLNAEGTEVILYGYIINEFGGVEEVTERTTTLNTDGTYAFDNVDFGIPNSAYGVAINYDGVEFSSGGMVDPTQTEMELALNVFESTDDASVVSIDQFNIIAEPISDELYVVTNVIGFNNASDKVFYSEQLGRSISFGVPPGAESIEFQDNQQLGGRFIRDGNTIHDTFYAYPGNHIIVFRYMLPISGNADLTIPVNYPVNEVSILVPQDKNLRANGFTLGEPQTLGEGVVFDRYSSTEVEGNIAFSVRSGVDAGAIARTAIVTGAIGGGIALLAYAFIVRMRNDEPAAGKATRYNKNLLQQIKELDAAYASGKLNPIDYEQRRAALKLAIAEDS